MSPRQQFTYDALYRLIQAQGRELIGTATFGSEDNWNDAAWQTTQKGDGNAVQNYTQLYTYDAVGNILELQHIATAGSYTRTYEIATVSNRLLSTVVGANTYNYVDDERGNMAAMPHLDAMYWNLNNELHQIENGTMQAFYQYSGGQRIRKYVIKGNVIEERIYLGSFEIYRKFENSSLIIERTTVHVSDDTGRIAMLEMRTEGNAGDDHGTAEELTRYIYSNHLQSASLELDETGDVISYEEYHPYGTTSYQAMNASIHAVAKRYRYTGKERDEESGLYYFQARFYICWLGRWLSPDPINSENYNLQKGNPQRNKERNYTELTASPYEYCYDSPVVYNDPTGEQPPIKEKDQTLKDGSGDVQHQKFTVQINGTESDFKRFKEAFTSDPSKVTNNMWATYVLKDLDKSKGLSAGDRIDIDITGPDNGSVRVVSVSSDNNSFQAMFQPLEGHPEAGHIVFTGTYSQNQQGEGVIEFTISNVTRQSLGVMKYMPGAESFGRYAQVDQWKEVMANVADFFGKNVSHASSSIAIRE